MSYSSRRYEVRNRANVYLPGVDVETWENALEKKSKQN